MTTQWITCEHEGCHHLDDLNIALSKIKVLEEKVDQLLFSLNALGSRITNMQTQGRLPS